MIRRAYMFLLMARIIMRIVTDYVLGSFIFFLLIEPPPSSPPPPAPAGGAGAKLFTGPLTAGAGARLGTGSGDAGAGLASVSGDVGASAAGAAGAGLGIGSATAACASSRGDIRRKSRQPVSGHTLYSWAGPFGTQPFHSAKPHRVSQTNLRKGYWGCNRNGGILGGGCGGSVQTETATDIRWHWWRWRSRRDMRVRNAVSQTSCRWR